MLFLLLTCVSCASSDENRENPLDRLGGAEPPPVQTAEPSQPVHKSKPIVKETVTLDFLDQGYDLGLPGFGKSVSKTSKLLDSLFIRSKKSLQPKAGYQAGFATALGDLNGDGFADIAVGLPNTRSTPAETDQYSWVFVYFGREFHESEIAPENADLIFYHRGGEESAYLGHSLAVADVNGDKLPDLLMGAPRTADEKGNDRAGAVYVFFGRKHWDRKKFEVREEADATLAGETAKSLAGFSIGTGDFNGDKIADVAVGAPGWGREINGEGRVYLVYGSRSLHKTRSLTDADLILTGEYEKEGQPIIDVKETSSRKPDSSGYALSMGDVNGDRFDDLMVGIPFSDGEKQDKSDSGEVSVFFGGKTGKAQRRIKSDADVRIFGAGSNDWFGISLASGDFNGDGKKDVIASAIHSSFRGNPNDRTGSVYVIYGSRSLPRVIQDPQSAGLTVWGRTGIAVDRSLFVYEEEDKSRSYFFGYSTTAGDLDGDGLDDLVIGMPAGAAKDDKRRMVSGEVFVVRGIPDDSGPRVIQSYADRRYLGEESRGQLGSALSLGDVNGDGVKDIVMGAPGMRSRSANHPETGKVYVVLGPQKEEIPEKAD